MTQQTFTDSIPERMPALLMTFRVDRDCLERTFATPFSPTRFDRLQRFYSGWQQTIDSIATASLCRSDRVDRLLFSSLLTAEQRRIADMAGQSAAITETLLPFAERLIALEERRRAFQDVDAPEAADRLQQTLTQIAALRSELSTGSKEISPTLAGQAAQYLGQLTTMLNAWYGFYHPYDPVFDWWVAKPYAALTEALTAYATFLKETIAGAVGDTILGLPIGRAALLVELAYAQVPYTPEELIAAGQKELLWCRQELERAAEEMGLGNDWRQAIEQVKSEHVAPGRQPALVRDLAEEAVAYVEENALVTVPPLAKECWRMAMMSAERQKTSPFFLGGETIIISFPTAEMAHPQKQMSLRGNNRHFARATVHHELIPGHHLQMFSMERYRPYRRLFWTPFWIEGWTLHWEMLLWERNFARTPEERVGMLFWRMHRAARVIFSLRFHLGEMTAAECVELLVTEARHERDNAVAEVRRSLEGNYGPLYQCAYLIGGWQMHALYRELVGGQKMSDRDFHDAVLQENCLPIPALRALLTGQEVAADHLPEWRFLPTA